MSHNETRFIKSELFTTMMRSHRELVELACKDALQAMSSAERSTDFEVSFNNDLSKASDSLAIAQRCVNALQQALRSSSSTGR